MPCSLADGAEELVELGALARIEAGRRLVEAEQERLGAHGARDLEPPLSAIGQLAGRRRRRGSMSPTRSSQ